VKNRQILVGGAAGQLAFPVAAHLTAERVAELDGDG